MITRYSYRTEDEIAVKTTIGALEALLDLVVDLPLLRLVASEHLSFETNSGERLERPSPASTAELVVRGLLALQEASRRFHERRRAGSSAIADGLRSDE